ncbi:hypothetical protein Vi05172_g929 [Venturia inaequalis]|nr:hypothetical protein Vi05172_g929 [Venturia inaequalis]
MYALYAKGHVAIDSTCQKKTDALSIRGTEGARGKSGDRTSSRFPFSTGGCIRDAPVTPVPTTWTQWTHLVFCVLSANCVMRRVPMSRFAHLVAIWGSSGLLDGLVPTTLHYGDDEAWQVGELTA